MAFCFSQVECILYIKFVCITDIQAESKQQSTRESLYCIAYCMHDAFKRGNYFTKHKQHLSLSDLTSLIVPVFTSKLLNLAEFSLVACTAESFPFVLSRVSRETILFWRSFVCRCRDEYSRNKMAMKTVRQNEHTTSITRISDNIVCW